MMKVRVAIGVAVLGAGLSGLAEAKPFSQLIVLSGSLTDTGNYASVNGPYPDPYYLHSRTTSGPVAIEFVAKHFGLSAEPSLHLVGPAVGTNFAFVGATASGTGPGDLAAQLQAYLGPRNGQADPDALHFVFIGANDIINAAVQPDDAVSEQIVLDAVAATESALRTLVRAGAKTIMAPNNVELGVTPAARFGGIAERATRLSQLYNRKFAGVLNRLQARNPRLDLIRWDFAKFVNDALRRADELRFTNTTDGCIELIPAGLCDLDHFAFFSVFYPAAKVHELMGHAMTIAIVQRKGPRPPRGEDASDEQ